MIKVIETITINGVETKMLFTPRLFLMAEEKEIKLIVEPANIMQTLSAYADICYCASLNYWTLENDVKAFPLKRVDFHEWAASNQEEFSKIMIIAAEAITGKTMKEMVQAEELHSDGDVKKKLKLSAIMERLKRFWSVIVE